MNDSLPIEQELQRAARLCKELSKVLGGLDKNFLTSSDSVRDKARSLVNSGGKALLDLEGVLQLISPQQFGEVGITLSRVSGIARFFALSFVSTDRKPLSSLENSPFFGSGVYAIYYSGDSEPAYAPISGSETPIYVGKADPKDPFAESIEDQGKALHRRLKEHLKSISSTSLPVEDFSFRYATIQSGMQASVELFMMNHFLPVWNKGRGPCFGIGKHGDSAKTRKNKRSPWDTMHPGRNWARKSTKNQKARQAIIEELADHFSKHVPFRTKEELIQKLLA